MKTRRDELIEEFIAGRMEGQTHAPSKFWCDCTKRGAREPNPKCKSCHGTGVVERGAGAHR